MGGKVSRTDFEWVYTEEPHATRRKTILKKHPEIKQLFGPDPLLKWVVTGMVLLQLVSLPLVARLSWPAALLMAYCFGGVINHSLMLAIHEISHNLAFGHNRVMTNQLFGIFTNLTIGIPFFMSFKHYHKDHHMYLAEDGYDPDLPTLLEAKLFATSRGKFFWVCLQPFFYAFRPLVVRPKTPTQMEIINAIVQVFFDLVVWKLFGAKVLVYLIFGSLITLSVHPMSGHLIAEHYMFKKGFETYSYYGPCNWLTFNAGYHVEHHDFPAVSWRKLPEVRRIAKEYYDNLPQHSSYVSVLWDFVTDPAIGPYARVKRRHNGLDS